jgi:hypothetical protein
METLAEIVDADPAVAKSATNPYAQRAPKCLEELNFELGELRHKMPAIRTWIYR